MAVAGSTIGPSAPQLPAVVLCLA
eukprot:COSAG01_NODE_25402_length_746_cov_1.126739_2_plen_23_part_01